MGLGGTLHKRVKRNRMLSEQAFNCLGWAVAQAQPDELGRVAVQQAALLEIGILGHNDKSILPRVLPDRGVGGVSKANLVNVNALRERSESKADSRGERFWSNSNFMPEESRACVRDPRRRPGKREYHLR